MVKWINLSDLIEQFSSIGSIKKINLLLEDSYGTLTIVICCSDPIDYVPDLLEFLVNFIQKTFKETQIRFQTTKHKKANNFIIQDNYLLKRIREKDNSICIQENKYYLITFFLDKVGEMDD